MDALALRDDDAQPAVADGLLDQRHVPLVVARHRLDDLQLRPRRLHLRQRDSLVRLRRVEAGESPILPMQPGDPQFP